MPMPYTLCRVESPSKCLHPLQSFDALAQDPEIALEDVENPTTPLKDWFFVIGYRTWVEIRDQEDPLVIGAPSAAGAEAGEAKDVHTNTCADILVSVSCSQKQ